MLGPSQKRKRVSYYFCLSLIILNKNGGGSSSIWGFVKASSPVDKKLKVFIFNPISFFFFFEFTDLVIEVIKDMPAWPGRHLLEGGEHRRYFGLKTVMRGVVEFECRNQREYDVWTQGVSRLLTIAAERGNNRHRG